jgi:prepilin signal peptidase PulO-like enzyme (type II secretory pathway)
MSAVSPGDAALAGAGRDDVRTQALGRAPLLRHPRRVVPLALGFGILAVVSYPLGADGATAACMAAVLIVLAGTDLERRIIPNRVVLPAAVIVLAARVTFFPHRSLEFILYAFGVAVAFLIPNLINSGLIGMGDVKFGFLLGAGLGSGVIGAIAIAAFSQLPFAVGTLIRGGMAARKTVLPFGPFLAFGGLVALILPRLLGHGGV